MEIKLSDLQKITNAIFKELEEYGVKKIEIDQDYYWYITKEERYEPRDKPSDPQLGQLTFDWEDLGNILSDKELVMSYSLKNLSSIFRAIADNLPF